MYDLQRTLGIEQEAGAQDGVFLDTGGQRLLEEFRIPGALHVLRCNVVVDAAEAFDLSVVDHPGLQRRHRVRVLVVPRQCANLVLIQQCERLQPRPVERGRRLLRPQRQLRDGLELEDVLNVYGDAAPLQH